MIYNHRKDDERIINLLKSNENVGEVIMMCHADSRVWCLLPVCTNKGISHVMGQLLMSSQEYAFASVFRSFLADFDDCNVITEVWGCLSPVCWPDSYIFRLV